MIIIGEKVNATRKAVNEAIQSRDEESIAALVKDQEKAGANIIDLNAGSGQGGVGQAQKDMQWLVDVAERHTTLPLAVDSEIPEVLEAGLAAIKGPSPWINSVSAEESRLESVLALTEKHSAPTVALCMGDDGIPKDVSGRILAAETIYKEAVHLGIDPGLLYFDPLVMPIGAEPQAGAMVLECLRSIKKNLPGANTVLGLSNVSFGLPLRPLLNSTFLVLCMGAGLDAAILDPCNRALMANMLAADALMGQDPYCGRFIQSYRNHQTEGE